MQKQVTITAICHTAWNIFETFNPCSIAGNSYCAV